MSEVIDLRRGPKRHVVATVGMVIFLVSWGTTFVALFIAYAILRARQPAWPPAGAPPIPLALPLANTVVAVASSVAFQRALEAIRVGRPTPFHRWLAAASALAATFLALQGLSWRSLWAAGLRAGESTYAGVFYLLTWFHAAHVLAALLVVAALVPGIVRGRYTARHHLPVKLTAWFWHFVTAAWFGTLTAAYLL